MTYRWLLLMIVLSLVACREPQTPARLASNGEQYFIETGHTIRGDFLSFFEIYGGVDSLGYPLTEEIQVDGWAVQYFEKGRLEYHPENEPDYRITVGWLGDLLQRRRPPIPPALIPPTGDPGRRYFPQTGHTLSGDFLRYFTDHGGSVRFGWPISEPFLWRGQLTQDFQSARFFWTPGGAEPVTLEKIGWVHFQMMGLDRQLLLPVPAGGEEP